MTIGSVDAADAADDIAACFPLIEAPLVALHRCGDASQASAATESMTRKEGEERREYDRACQPRALIKSRKTKVLKVGRKLQLTLEPCASAECTAFDLKQ
jgi:hypothetical protein